MRYIGDVHGKFGQYAHLLDSCKESIQVGDMGVGFPTPTGKSMPPEEIMKPNTHHRFIRGNHDDPIMCRNHSQYIPDGMVENDTMFVGGAYSIDKDQRTVGIDYWEDEECSYSQLGMAIDTFITVQPKIMVTHECPNDVANALFGVNGKLRFDIPSRTRTAFQTMFEAHQPDLWIFGHWHINKIQKINGTTFVCLGELSYMDI